MFRHVCELTSRIMVNSHSLTCRGSSEVCRSKAALAAVATRCGVQDLKGKEMCLKVSHGIRPGGKGVLSLIGWDKDG